MHSIWLRYLSFALGAGLGAPAVGATWTVDTLEDAPDTLAGDGTCLAAGWGCTLRAAIQEANALPGVDQIDIPGGSYFLKLRQATVDDTAVSGDLDILEPLTLRGVANEQLAMIQDHFILHTDEGERLFDVQTGDAEAPVRFENLLLSFGKSHDSLGGGAILVRAGSAAVVDRSILYANGADAVGNAMAVYGSADLIRSHVFDNHRSFDGAPGIGGGGIYVAPGASLRIDASAFGSNTHCRGGSLFADGPSSVQILRSTFLGSSANHLGGCEDSDGFGDIIALRGAVTLTVENSTLGEARELLHTAGADARILLRHVTQHSVSLTGGWTLDGSGVELALSNSVIGRGASMDWCTVRPDNQIINLGGNVFQHGPPCAISARPDDRIATDLALSLLQLNDAGSGVSIERRAVFVPQVQSAAIDAAVEAHCAAADQLLNPRPSPGPLAPPGSPPRCDAGAIEWPGTPLLSDGFESP